MTKKNLILIALVIGTAIILVYGTIWTKRYFEIDSCLDNGGKWNYELNKCENIYNISAAEINDLYWHSGFDSIRNYEYLEKGKLLDSISATPNNLIEILNRRNIKCKIELIQFARDTISIRITNDEYLTEQIGSSGAFCFLGETVYTLTEHNLIKYVKMEFNYGSHASPGVYCRNDFKELIRNEKP